jgi:hypothetical protein
MEEQMQWTDLRRGLAMLAAAPALVLAACGGGDKNVGPDNGADVDTWEMVALGNAGLPADAEVEDCRLTRFDQGKLELREDGSWRITLRVNDVSGDLGYHDEGEYQSNGDTGWFRSQITGTTYQAAYDGTDLRIDYDWCENGVPDVQLVFE